MRSMFGVAGLVGDIIPYLLHIWHCERHIAICCKNDRDADIAYGRRGCTSGNGTGACCITIGGETTTWRK